MKADTEVITNPLLLEFRTYIFSMFWNEGDQKPVGHYENKGTTTSISWIRLRDLSRCMRDIHLGMFLLVVWFYDRPYTVKKVFLGIISLDWQT